MWFLYLPGAAFMVLALAKVLSLKVADVGLLKYCTLFIAASVSYAPNLFVASFLDGTAQAGYRGDPVLNTFYMLVYVISYTCVGMLFVLDNWRELKDSFYTERWPKDLILLILSVFVTSSPLLTLWYIVRAFFSLI